MLCATFHLADDYGDALIISEFPKFRADDLCFSFAAVIGAIRHCGLSMRYYIGCIANDCPNIRHESESFYLLGFFSFLALFPDKVVKSCSVESNLVI